MAVRLRIPRTMVPLVADQRLGIEAEHPIGREELGIVGTTSVGAISRTSQPRRPPHRFNPFSDFR